MSSALPSLMKKVNDLFAHVVDDDGSRLTNGDVAQRARDSGYRISEAYVSQLRTGRARNPSFQVVVAVANAFGVPITFFLDQQMTVGQARQLYAATTGGEGGAASGSSAIVRSTSELALVTEDERHFLEAAVRLMRAVAPSGSLPVPSDSHGRQSS